MCSLAWAQWNRGKLRQAIETHRQILRLMNTDEEEELPGLAGIGGIYPLMAGILCEWNDLNAAVHHLQQGIEIGKQWKSEMALYRGYTRLLMMCLGLGDMNGAAEAAQNAMQLMSMPSVTVVESILALQARNWLAQGDLEAAVRWARESGFSVDGELRYTYLLIEHLTLVRVLLAQDKPDEAMRLLMRLLMNIFICLTF